VQNHFQGASTFQKARTKKPSAQKAQKVQNHLQGASTFQKARTKKTFSTKGTISAKRTLRGFDLSKDPNKKPSAQKAQKVQNHRQGASTFQKARTKKTFGTNGTKSAKPSPKGFDLSKGPNQKRIRHNKYITNAKGLRPVKRSEPKNLRHKGHNKCKTIAKVLRPFKKIELKKPLAQRAQ